MKKLFVISICLIFAFVSCGNKGVVSSQSEDVELELHYYKQENVDGLKKVISSFEKSNPTIKINLIASPNSDDSFMQSKASVGELPDIIQIASYARIKEYASRGLILDLSKNKMMEKVLPSAMPAVSWNGKQYAVPMDYSGIGILYNKDIFKKYNLTPPETLNELKYVCSVLKSNGINPFSGLLKDNWSMGHFITLIHTALLKKANIDLERFVTNMNAGKGSYGDVDVDELFEIIDFYRDNMNSNAPECDGGDQQKNFAGGLCAMMVQGLWAYTDTMKLNPKLDIGFIPFPVSNVAKYNAFFADVDSAFAISSQSSKQKTAAALKFLDWLATSEGEKAWLEDYRLIAPFKGVDVTSFGGPFVDLMKSVEAKGSLIWLFSQYPTLVFDDGCKNGAQLYALHRKSASQVIKEIDSQWIKATSK